jgi:N-acetylmuramoyl-L-alanine amidase
MSGVASNSTLCQPARAWIFHVYVCGADLDSFASYLQKLVKSCRRLLQWRAAWAAAILGCEIAVACVPYAAFGQTVIAKTSPAPAQTDATAAPGDQSLRVSAARLSNENGRATFGLSLSAPMPVQVFTLANPYRIVIDLPEVAFELPSAAGRMEQGLISGYRFGLFGHGSSRVVIDTTGPVRIVRTALVTLASGGVEQQVEFEATTAEAFVVTSGVPQRASAAALKPSFAVRDGAAAATGKFVVMIDPGHGGIDAGAVGPQMLEKDVVLAVSRYLKAALEGKGLYDVRMTRTGDTFVGLDQRVAMSEAAQAKLFISIHADSVDNSTVARSARGATVYTLSEKASNEAARALAEKENNADAIAGLTTRSADDQEQVNGILADLIKRETQSFSAKFQQVLLDRMRPANLLARDPARSAAFRVLRQVQTPTVLIELGFISNQTDAEQMRLAEWQKNIATTIAGAVDSYTTQRSARGGP